MIAGLLVLAAACSSTDNSTGTSADDAQINSDISAAAADGFAEDVNVISGMDGQVGSAASINGGADIMGRGGWRPGLTGCSFVGGEFNCPSVTKNGLTVTRSRRMIRFSRHQFMSWPTSTATAPTDRGPQP
jgi:hypothetical protein